MFAVPASPVTTAFGHTFAVDGAFQDPTGKHVCFLLTRERLRFLSSEPPGTWFVQARFLEDRSHLQWLADSPPPFFNVRCGKVANGANQAFLEPLCVFPALALKKKGGVAFDPNSYFFRLLAGGEQDILFLLTDVRGGGLSLAESAQEHLEGLTLAVTLIKT